MLDIDLEGAGATLRGGNQRFLNRPISTKFTPPLTMLTKGEEYTDQGQQYYEERYRQRVLHALTQRAAKLGLKMVAIEQPA